MKIYVRVKSAGKRRPVFDDADYDLSESVSTVREFLEEIVRVETERYNQKGTDVQVIPFLTDEEISDQAEIGKVGFGRIFSDQKADFKAAAENAVRCFEDGLVRVFQNEKELTELNMPVEIQEGDRFTLIRLTFLAGRLW